MKLSLLGVVGQLALVTLSRKLARDWGLGEGLSSPPTPNEAQRPGFEEGAEGLTSSWREMTAASVLEPSSATLALEKELPVTAESLVCHDSAV